MNEELAGLQEDLLRLEKERAERRATIPAHTIRPHQLLRLEELDDEIAELKDKISKLS